jgi:hypothetical protein
LKVASSLPSLRFVVASLRAKTPWPRIVEQRSLLEPDSASPAPDSSR